ncbi:DUF6722 family protein [uncultured Parabacteroides sp.]|jgi:hypothetical protein|uniref:DUF6722 family protein n=1 Tax=uncultured Parabacteroides sp. TaxID=512312 RepID=UPI0025F643A0|nr:DUF6722 family protein [uncultured Parabacteroides sp.]
MEKELGKFLLDVAKLIIAGVILATIMDDVTSRWLIYMLGGLSIFLLVTFGLYLIDNNKLRRQ